MARPGSPHRLRWRQRVTACSGAPDKIRLTGPITNFDTGEGTQTFIGPVRGDVTRLLVTLTNGQVLSLHPVKVFGQRYPGYVGLVLPRAEVVTMITGYSGRREIGYEIPFTKFGFITTPILLKPGQPPLPERHTYLIASGTLLGSRWKEHLYVGPWGSCVGNAFGGGTCQAIAARDLAGEQLVREVSESFRGNSAGIVVFAVASNVSYLRISSSHAPAFTVHCINAAGARMCAAGFVPKAHWTAYAVDGTKLGSGGL